MTNTDTQRLAAFSADQLNALSGEQRGNFASQLIAAGHDKEQVEKALRPPALAPAQEPPPVTSSLKQSPVPDNETRAMAENLKRHWSGDQAALDATLKRMGIEFSTDPRTEAEKSFDAGFSTPAKNDYRLNYIGRNMGDAGKLADLNGKFNAAFSAMQLPASLGQGILDAMLNSSANFAKLNPTQKALYGREQKVLVEKLGKDIGDHEKIMAYTAIALRNADKDFVKELIDNGSIESASAILQLARQGQRLVHRQRLFAARGV